MSLDAYKKLVDELAADYDVGRIGFGLYGDPLLDRFIGERVRYAREKLEATCLVINTNAAAYSPRKHAEALQAAHVVAIHIESMDAKVYNKIMSPLRLDRVMPKIEQIVREFGQKVTVVAPLHRWNHDEQQKIRDHFLALGCSDVAFPSITNRCSAEGDTIFRELAFAPVKNLCSSAILKDNLIIDWDGTVLPCCQDFQKLVPIGSLKNSNIKAALASQDRAAFGRMLDSGDDSSTPTCRNCYVDTPPAPNAI
jgi:radical SAM protein with 4Fe4S-binding SPASM domain